MTVVVGGAGDGGCKGEDCFGGRAGVVRYPWVEVARSWWW